MCHNGDCDYFPAPDPTGTFSGEIEGVVFGETTAAKKIAIIPDIYGPGPFYQGFAQYLSQHDAAAFLVNPFAALGDLTEVTREAAFARRHRLEDKAFVDRFAAFCEANRITGIVGFCLGGSYVFELARRNSSQDLVGFYGFPQGMENSDPLPIPFDYLAELEKPHLSLMPGQDASVGRDNVERLKVIGDTTEGLDVRVYEQSGHGFLTDVDSDNQTLRSNAVDALEACSRHLGLAA